jgi:hypothetical protein
MHFVSARKSALLACFTVLALAACDSLPAGTAPTAAPPSVELPTAAPSSTPPSVELPTAAPSSTPLPVTPSPTSTPTLTPTEPPPSPSTPTALPPSSTPAPPTPTLAPLDANTIPEGGEFEDELPFNTTASDPAIGSNSGDGIANVTFQFFGPDGDEVYRRTENNSLYCAFGGGDNGQECNRWIFSEHNNQWPNGNPAQSGLHTIVVTIQGVRGGTARNERQATLNLIEE